MTKRDFEIRYIAKGVTEHKKDLYLKIDGNGSWAWTWRLQPYMFKTPEGAYQAIAVCDSYLKPIDESIEVWKVEEYKPKIVLLEKVLKE